MTTIKLTCHVDWMSPGHKTCDPVTASPGPFDFLEYSIGLLRMVNCDKCGQLCDSWKIRYSDVRQLE